MIAGVLLAGYGLVMAQKVRRNPSAGAVPRRIVGIKRASSCEHADPIAKERIRPNHASSGMAETKAEAESVTAEAPTAKPVAGLTAECGWMSAGVLVQGLFRMYVQSKCEPWPGGQQGDDARTGQRDTDDTLQWRNRGAAGDALTDQWRNRGGAEGAGDTMPRNRGAAAERWRNRNRVVRNLATLAPLLPRNRSAHHGPPAPWSFDSLGVSEDEEKKKKYDDLYIEESAAEGCCDRGVSRCVNLPGTMIPSENINDPYTIKGIMRSRDLSLLVSLTLPTVTQAAPKSGRQDPVTPTSYDNRTASAERGQASKEGRGKSSSESTSTPSPASPSLTPPSMHNSSPEMGPHTESPDLRRLAEVALPATVTGPAREKKLPTVDVYGVGAVEYLSSMPACITKSEGHLHGNNLPEFYYLSHTTFSDVQKRCRDRIYFYIEQDRRIVMWDSTRRVTVHLHPIARTFSRCAELLGMNQSIELFLPECKTAYANLSSDEFVEECKDLTPEQRQRLIAHLTLENPAAASSSSAAQLQHLQCPDPTMEARGCVKPDDKHTDKR